MTIPISPGPFSFLAQLGQAGGEAFAAHEKDRQQKVKEAKDVLNSMIELRSKGFLTPEEFASPNAMKIYQTLGIAPASAQPTAEEQKSRDIMEFIQSRAGAAPGTPQADERAAALGLPSRATSGKVSAEVAQNKAAVPVAEVQGATAEAQLPQAGATASLEQVGKQQDALGAIADQVVSSVYNTTKKLPSPEQAYAAAQADERAAPYKAQLTQEVIGQAVEKQRRVLAEEDIRRRLAAAAQDRADRPLAGQQLKPIPQTIIKSLTENQLAVGSIDDAITALNTSPKAKGAIGHWWNLLPDYVVQRLNKQGTDIRSDIANVGSLTFRDRSGVAVTVSEARRLRPFVPSTTDPPEIAARKLSKLKDYIQGENDAFQSYYTPDNGFHPYESGSGTPQTAPSTGDPLEQQAQDAIAKGADPEAVKKRLEELRKKK